MSKRSRVKIPNDAKAREALWTREARIAAGLPIQDRIALVYNLQRRAFAAGRRMGQGEPMIGAPAIPSDVAATVTVAPGIWPVTIKVDLNMPENELEFRSGDHCIRVLLAGKTWQTRVVPTEPGSYLEIDP